MNIADKLIRKSEVVWEIPKSTRKDMRVPARIIALEALLPAITSDKSLHQLLNVSTLPGIELAALVMPDAHEGYGFPIGGVAATRHPDGVISPGGIGYDINCGVRLLRTQLTIDDIKPQLGQLAKELYAQVPSGMGKGGQLKLNLNEIDAVLKKGAGWAIDHHYGKENDLEYLESQGCLEGADPGCVSKHAKKRGSNQLGTIGSGNHFVEVDRVEDIFHQEAAQAFDLHPRQIVILIHTGSRGLGHQVATDHIRTMMRVMPAYEIRPPDRELACVPFSSKEGQDYFKAMLCAANFAWCNRQVITWEVREAFKNVFGPKSGDIDIVYDVAHNIAKIEDHMIEGELKRVIVHRKGATRAFGPGFQGLPGKYINVGQPVLIPGSMGTESYVLVGTEQSMLQTFGSSCHGAGRRLSRRAAKKQVDAPKLQMELLKKGIHIEAGSYRGIAEEAPIAYKDVNLVVESVHRAGIALKVANLKPVAVIKG